MRIIKTVAIIVLAFSMFSFINGDYLKVKPGKGISVEIPSDLEQLSEEAVIKKFGAHNLPIGVYSDYRGNTTFAVNMISDTVKYKNKIGVKSKDPFMERMFKKSSVMNLFANVKFIQDTIVMHSDLPAIKFEFIGDLIGQDNKGNKTATKTYVFITYLFKKNNTYIFNFACPVTEQSKWQQKAQYSMNSIKIK